MLVFDSRCFVSDSVWWSMICVEDWLICSSRNLSKGYTKDFFYSTIVPSRIAYGHLRETRSLPGGDGFFPRIKGSILYTQVVIGLLWYTYLIKIVTRYHLQASRSLSRSTPTRATLIKIVKRRALAYATRFLSVYLIYVTFLTMSDNDGDLVAVFYFYFANEYKSDTKLQSSLINW
jgi:hypothetical protein